MICRGRRKVGVAIKSYGDRPDVCLDCIAVCDNCTIDLQDVTVERKWIEGVEDVCIIIALCESIIISK